MLHAGRGSTSELYVYTDKTNPVVGILGPGCSSVAVNLASTAALFNYVVFSASAGLGALGTDKSVYPTFLRAIAGHEATFVPPIMALFEHFNWKRIGIVSEMSAVPRGIHHALSAEADRKGVVLEVEVNVGLDDGPAAAAKLIEGNVRVVVLLAFAPVGRHVICAALRAGDAFAAGANSTGNTNSTSSSSALPVSSRLISPRHAWILMGHNPGAWWERDAADKHDCSDDELKVAVQVRRENPSENTV